MLVLDTDRYSRFRSSMRDPGQKMSWRFTGWRWVGPSLFALVLGALVARACYGVVEVAQSEDHGRCFGAGCKTVDGGR